MDNNFKRKIHKLKVEDKMNMDENIIPSRIIRLLENAEFLCVATRDTNGNPHVANKFLIKCEGNCLYIGDYAKGETWRSLKSYPKVSIAIMDTDNLIDYQINGRADLVDPGADFKELMNTFSEKELRFSVKRLIESVRKGKSRFSYRLPFYIQGGMVCIRPSTLHSNDLEIFYFDLSVFSSYKIKVANVK